MPWFHLFCFSCGPGWLGTWYVPKDGLELLPRLYLPSTEITGMSNPTNRTLDLDSVWEGNGSSLLLGCICCPKFLCVHLHTTPSTNTQKYLFNNDFHVRYTEDDLKSTALRTYWWSSFATETYDNTAKCFILPTLLLLEQTVWESS